MPVREPNAWMWREASRLLDEMERVQRHFFRPAEPIGWEPPIDVFETDLEIWVLVALPGVDPSSVEIEILEDVLAVRGRRSIPGALRRAAIRRLEIPHGRFERRVDLGGARFELCVRDLRDGCLVVGLRKT